MGTGHVMRCLTLCRAWQEQGAKINFICREQDGDLCDWLSGQGVQVHRLPPARLPTTVIDTDATEHSQWLGLSQAQDAKQTIDILETVPTPTWLIVDHYGLSDVWHRVVRPYTDAIMVIDDLADRAYAADLLLDQNLGRQQQDYKDLTTAPVLAGLDYSLLRPEFRILRESAEVRESLSKVVVTLGGADADNVTLEILDALIAFDDVLQGITVILGGSNPHVDTVEAKRGLFKSAEVRVLQGITNVAEEFVDADLAIGAAGGTSWERCALGLPTIVIQLAANQGLAATALAETGAAIGLDRQDIDRSLPVILQQLLTSPDKLRRMSERAFALVDAKGLDRVVAAMKQVARSRP